MAPDTGCLTPVEFKMTLKANCNVPFIIILWILKSPTNKALSATGTNSGRKSAKQYM